MWRSAALAAAAVATLAVAFAYRNKPVPPPVPVPVPPPAPVSTSLPGGMTADSAAATAQAAFDLDALAGELARVRSGLLPPAVQPAITDAVRMLLSTDGTPAPAITYAGLRALVVASRQPGWVQERLEARAKSLTAAAADYKRIATEELIKSDAALFERVRAAGRDDRDSAWLFALAPPGPADDAPLVRLLGAVALAQVEATATPAARKGVDAVAARVWAVVLAGPDDPTAMHARLRADAVRLDGPADTELTLGRLFDTLEEHHAGRLDGPWVRFLGRFALAAARRELPKRATGYFADYYRPLLGGGLDRIVAELPPVRAARAEALAARLQTDPGAAGLWYRALRPNPAAELPELLRLERPDRKGAAVTPADLNTRAGDLDGAKAAADADVLAADWEATDPAAADARRVDTFLTSLSWSVFLTAPQYKEAAARLRKEMDTPEAVVPLVWRWSQAARVSVPSGNRLADVRLAADHLGPVHAAAVALRQGPVRVGPWALAPRPGRAQLLVVGNPGRVILRNDFELTAVVATTAAERLSPTGITLIGAVAPQPGGRVTIGDLKFGPNVEAEVAAFGRRLGPAAVPAAPSHARFGAASWSKTGGAAVDGPHDGLAVGWTLLTDLSADAAFPAAAVVRGVESGWQFAGWAGTTGPPVQDLAAAARAELRRRVERPAVRDAILARAHNRLAAVGLAHARAAAVRLDDRSTFDVDGVRLALSADGTVTFAEATYAGATGTTAARHLLRGKLPGLRPAVVAEVAGAARYRNNAWEIRLDLAGPPRLATPWLSADTLTAGADQPAPRNRLPGGLAVVATAVGEAGGGLRVAVATGFDAPAVPVGHFDVAGAATFRPAVDRDALSRLVAGRAERDLPDLLSRFFPDRVPPQPLTVPADGVTVDLRPDGTLAARVTPRPLDIPVDLAAADARLILTDAPALAARITPGVVERAGRVDAQARADRTRWFEQSHPVTLAGAALDLTFEAPPPGADPRRLTGAGTLRVGTAVAKVRVGNWSVTREPAADEPLSAVTDPERSDIRLDVLDISTVAAALPGHDSLVRQLGLRLAAVRYANRRWVVDGVLSPPGGGRVPFALTTAALTPAELTPALIKAAVEALPPSLTVVQDRMTVTLERKPDGDRPPYFDVTVAVSGPVPLLVTAGRLGLDLTNNEVRWTDAATVAVPESAKAVLRERLAARLLALGVGGPTAPEVDVTVPEPAPRVGCRDGDITLDIRGTVRLVPPRSGLVPAAGLSFTFRDGRFELDDAPLHRPAPTDGPFRDIARRWLDDCLSGLGGDDLGGGETGRVADVSVVEDRVRQRPLDAGGVGVRVLKVHSFAYYLLRTNPTRVDFAPALGPRAADEADAAFAIRAAAYRARLAEVGGRLGEYGLEFDAELVIPAVGRVTVQGADQRPAFRLDAAGLRMRQGGKLLFAVHGDPRPSALLAVAGPRAEWLADLADAVTLDIGWQRAGPPADGEWVAVDPRDLALTVDVRLRRKAVADRLTPVDDRPDDGAAVARLRLDGRGVTVEAVQTPDEVCDRVLSWLRPVALPVGPLTLTVDRVGWRHRALELSGHVRGVVPAVGRRFGLDADDEPLAFHDVRVGPRGLDVSAAAFDLAPVANLLPAWLRKSGLAGLTLGDLDIRLAAEPRARDGAVQFGLEARFVVLGRPVGVRLDDIAVRCGIERGDLRVEVLVGGEPCADPAALARRVGERLVAALGEELPRLGPIGVGAVRLRLTGARLHEARLVVDGTVAVDGWLEEVPWQVGVDAAGRLTFDHGVLADRLARPVAARLAGDADDFWKKLAIGGVHLVPRAKPGPAHGVLAWDIAAQGSLTLPALTLNLTGVVVAAVELDCRAGTLAVRPAERLASQLAGVALDAAQAELRRRFDGPDKPVRLALFGEEVAVRVRWDPDRGEVLADLEAAVVGGRLVAPPAGTPDDRVVRLADIRLLGTRDDPRPSFDRVRVVRPAVLVEWTTAKIGLSRYVKVTTADVRGRMLVLSAALTVPGYVSAVVEDVEIPLDGDAAAVARAVLNGLLAQMPNKVVRLAGGTALTLRRCELGDPLELQLHAEAAIAVAGRTVVLPGTLIVRPDGFAVDFSTAKDVLAHNLKGMIGLLLGDGLAWATGDIVRLSADILWDPTDERVPVGCVVGGRFNLGFLDEGFAGLVVEFAGLTVRDGVVTPPAEYKVIVGVQVNIGAVALYDIGGKYSGKHSEIQLLTKLTAGHKQAGRLAHVDAGLTLPMARLTRIRLDGRLVVFGQPMAVGFGELDFRRRRLEQAFETVFGLDRAVRLRGRFVIDAGSPGAAADLEAQVLGCQVAEGELALDFVKQTLTVRGRAVVGFVTATGAFTLREGWDDPHLRAHAAAGLPGFIDLATLNVDADRRRVVVLARVPFASARVVFRRPDEVNADAIAAELRFNLGLGGSPAVLDQLLSGEFTESLSPAAAESADPPALAGDDGRSGPGRQDAGLETPTPGDLPAGGTRLQIGRANAGDVEYAFFERNGERFVQIEQKSSGRRATLRADFGTYGRDSRFALVEEAFKAGRLVVHGVGLRDGAPVAGVEVTFSGAAGATPAAPLRMYWDGTGGAVVRAEPYLCNLALPPDAEPVTFGQAGQGDVRYAFYVLKGKRYVAMADKDGRAWRMKADFGSYVAKDDRFAAAEKAFVENKLVIQAARVGDGDPPARVEIELTGVEGATADKPLRVVWAAE